MHTGCQGGNGAFAGVLAIWLLATAGPGPVRHHEAARLSMGCVYAIDAYGPDGAALPRAVEQAFDEVDRIDRLMSNYKADSALARVNREAALHPVAVNSELFAFIAEAMRYSRESGGAFDITVGPLMKTWGFFGGDGRMPADGQLASARRHVGARHVILDRAAGTIAFDAPGVELDLGGIAKGYAVDRAARVLRQNGVEAALVSAGGSTTVALGTPPDRDGWPVTVQDPVDARRTAFTTLLRDRAISVAGSSEKFFEEGGVKYSHIMDPRTGKPAQGVLSVVVLTGSGTAGDALDDALFVLGPSDSRRCLRRFPETEAFFFMPDDARGWRLVRVRPGSGPAARLKQARTY
jgi:thiamine biosynthesis lipoprotein